MATGGHNRVYLPFKFWQCTRDVRALTSSIIELAMRTIVGVPTGHHVPVRDKGARKMGFDQYHEPAQELSEEARTFARMNASLTEEAEAIGWYEQRLAVEKDPEARAIMSNAQQEEFKHFCMDLEFLLRRKPVWREIAQGVLLQEGDIVSDAEQAEEDAT